MKAAEYEKHKNEIDEQAKNLAREVRKIHAGTDEGTLQRKAEEQKKREEREECLRAADVLEKMIECIRPLGCPLIDCSECAFKTTIPQRIDAFKIAVKVLRENGENGSGEDGMII